MHTQDELASHLSLLDASLAKANCMSTMFLQVGSCVAEVQALHLDAAPGVKQTYSAIAPLTDGFSLLVVPNSHLVYAIEDGGRPALQPAHSLPLSRITLKRGDLLVYHGNLAHAGDAGVPGQKSPHICWRSVSGQEGPHFCELQAHAAQCIPLY
jgi:hypothetical protein